MSSIRPRVVLARLLLDSGLADIALLGMATRIAAEGDVSLVHALVRWRLVPGPGLCRLLADGTGLATTSLDTFDGPLPTAVSRVTCARLRVLPLWRRGDILGLGMADPTDDGAAQELGRATGLTVERLLVDDDELDLALRRVFGWTSSTTPQPAGLAASTPLPGPGPAPSSGPPASPPPLASPTPVPSPPPLASPTPVAGTPPATPAPMPSPPPGDGNHDELPTLDTSRPVTRMPTAASPPVPRLQVTEPPQDIKFTDVRSELFVDSIVDGISIVDDEPFMSQSSGVFSTNTVDIPMIGESASSSAPPTPPLAPPPPLHRPAPPPPPTLTPPPAPIAPPPPVMTPTPPYAANPRPPTRAPAPLVSEATSEVDMRLFGGAEAPGHVGADVAADFPVDFAEDFEDASTALVAAATAAATADSDDADEPSDDKTIPNDNLLFVMRVLLVGDGPALESVGAMLRRRVRQFQLVNLLQAGGEVDQRRYDAVVVVDPPDSVTGSYLLAQLAGKARNGVVVVSASTEMARVPGVRTVQTRPPDDQLGDVIVDMLQRRARGD